MKKLNLIILITILIFNLSCSSDDDNGNLPNQEQNGFTFNGSFYPTDFLYLADGNNQTDFITMGIFLSNFEFNVDCGIDNGQYVVLEFDPDQNSNVFEQETYNSNDYSFIDKVVGINTIIDTNCDFQGADFIANEAEPGLDSTNITINILSISQNNIELEYIMIREDGAEINGYYSGTFEYGDFF
jgi:hypothetical protein